MTPELSEHDPLANQETVTVLIVCTGNICRSPVAELLLRDQVDDSVTIISAGTRARNGQPIAEPMATVLRMQSFRMPSVSSQPLNEALIQRSSLILTMTTAHRAEVVSVAPSAIRRTFTVLEFARLAAAVESETVHGTSDAARIRNLVPLAIAQRAKLSAQRPNNDVRDPLNRSRATNRKVFRILEQAITTITTTLHTGSPSRPQTRSEVLGLEQETGVEAEHSTVALGELIG